MYLNFFLLTLWSLAKADKRYYETYTGDEIDFDTYQQLKTATNPLFGTCAVEVDDCDPNEGRRVGGACNNLKYPSKGATCTRGRRLLPPIFYNGTEPRRSASGCPLELSRKIRTTLLSEGRVTSLLFTHLLTNNWLFMAVDVAFPIDSVNFILVHTKCCDEEGKKDPFCSPVEIPEGDPVHRFSGYRCQNMTQPYSYENVGCAPKGSSFSRIGQAPPAMDLSIIYGKTIESCNAKRQFQGGLLMFEEQNGKIFPPSLPPAAARWLCRANHFDENETRCHNTPDLATNALHGITLLSVLYYRQHNRLANELAEVNPCWTDEQLFQTARDINIAFALHIYYYQMLPLVFGRDNLIRDGIILADDGFRDIYNESLFPSVSLEYQYALRWVHIMQEGVLKLYDTDGNYVKQFPIVNGTLRTGWLEKDNNMELVTQCNFRQAAAGIDYVVDPDMAEEALGSLQRNFDVFTNDNEKSRHYGLQPYVEYRKLCTGKNYTSFDDLRDVIDEEKIEALKEVYLCVTDIDLMAGMWIERQMEGSYVPPTLYCLVTEHLKYNVQSDRHWFERPNRPNAFTADQLKVIRKASISRLLCSAGDSVKEITPNAFLRPGPGNEIASCDEATQDIDFAAFKDESCDCSNSE